MKAQWAESRRLRVGTRRFASGVGLSWPVCLWAVEPVGSSISAVGASAAIPFRSAADSATPAPSAWGLAILVCAVALVVLVALLKRYGRQLNIGTLGHKDVQVLEKSLIAPGIHLVVVATRGAAHASRYRHRVHPLFEGRPIGRRGPSRMKPAVSAVPSSAHRWALLSMVMLWGGATAASAAAPDVSGLPLQLIERTSGSSEMSSAMRIFWP